MPDSPALARLRGGHFNTGDWNAGTNPGGMGGDGHRYAMVPPKAPQVAAYPVMVNDVVAVIDEVVAAALAAGDAAAAAAIVDAAITAFNTNIKFSGADPGAVGAGKAWFDTGAGVLKVRNAANTAWSTIALPSDASEAIAGLVRLASPAEALAATLTDRAVTPAGLSPLITAYLSAPYHQGAI